MTVLRKITFARQPLQFLFTMNYAKQTDVSLWSPDVVVGTTITLENSSKLTWRCDLYLTFLKGFIILLHGCQVTHKEMNKCPSVFAQGNSNVDCVNIKRGASPQNQS